MKIDYSQPGTFYKIDHGTLGKNHMTKFKYNRQNFVDKYTLCDKNLFIFARGNIHYDEKSIWRIKSTFNQYPPFIPTRRTIAEIF